jgi:peroxiredoxin
MFNRSFHSKLINLQEGGVVMSNKKLRWLVTAVMIIGIIGSSVFYSQPIKRLGSELQVAEVAAEDKESTDKEEGVEVGKIAPDFTLSNLAGEDVSLSDFRGQYVLLNFWATWCPPCRQEMPELNSFSAAENDFVVVGVNIGEQPNKVKKFMEDNGYNYPTLLDQTREIASIYQVSAIPTSYFIDPTGEIKHIKRGLIMESQLEAIEKQVKDE